MLDWLTAYLEESQLEERNFQCFKDQMYFQKYRNVADGLCPWLVAAILAFLELEEWSLAGRWGGCWLHYYG